MYSDGILEAQGKSEEEFGEERILRIVQENCDKSPNEICHAILSGVHDFLGNDAPHDDQTLLIVRLEPARQLQTERVYEAVACA